MNTGESGFIRRSPSMSGGEAGLVRKSPAMNISDTGILRKPSPVPVREESEYTASFQTRPGQTYYQDSAQQEEIQMTKGDAKTEVHFCGQILGGEGFVSDDGLFCEMLVQVGENWQYLAPRKLYQTQTCYADIDEIFVWAHPIDLHLSAGSLSGW